MTGHEADTRRIRDAFEEELASYHAPAGLAERARTGGLRRARRRRIRRAASLTAACAAVLAGLAIVPLAGPGPSGLPSAAALGRAMLSALPAVSGDIMYERQVGLRGGVLVIESRLWIWPAQPAPRQQVRVRNVYAQWIPPSAGHGVILPSVYAQPIRSIKGLTLVDDTGLAFKSPRPVYTSLRSGTPVTVNPMTSIRLTQVCYLRVGRCGGGPGPTRARTWSTASYRYLVPRGSDISRGDVFYPPAIAREILTGQWRVVRHARIDGQPAVELRGARSGVWGPGGIGPPCPQPVPPSVFFEANGCPARESLLWVNARTHLPLRWTGVAGTTVIAQTEFAYLPPTPANLALLRVPIPHGFPRSHEPPPGSPGY